MVVVLQESAMEINSLIGVKIQRRMQGNKNKLFHFSQEIIT
jgi:hypothetical protein